MGMTTTVTAKDTASAMEDIAAQLGDNAVILSSRKVGNLIEMTASNARAAQNAVKKRNTKKSFKNIFQNQKNVAHTENVVPIEQKPREMHENTQQNIKDLNNTNNYETLEQIHTAIELLDKKMEGMVITEESAISQNNFSSIPLKLKQLGFSRNIVMSLKDSYAEKNYEDARVSFLRSLAQKLSFKSPDRVLKSKLVLVTGTSGSGKTTLAAKIASKIVDKTGPENIVLAELCRKSPTASENLRSYARLLNLPLTNQIKDCDLSDTMLLNDNATIVVDLAGDIEAGNKIIQNLESRHGDEYISTVLALPAGSSKEMITNTWKTVKAQRPMVALTKLDECEISAINLSTLAEISARIGLITGTRAIIDSLAFANDDILAQYMKEIC